MKPHRLDTVLRRELSKCKHVTHAAVYTLKKEIKKDGIVILDTNTRAHNHHILYYWPCVSVCVYAYWHIGMHDSNCNTGFLMWWWTHFHTPYIESKEKKWKEDERKKTEPDDKQLFIVELIVKEMLSHLDIKITTTTTVLKHQFWKKITFTQSVMYENEVPTPVRI